MRSITVSVLLILALSAEAATIAVDVSGEITRASPLVPDVPVGAPFAFTLRYSDAIADSSIQSDVGIYRLDDPALAIEGHINGFVFRNRLIPELEIRVPPAVFQTPTVNVTVRNFGNDLFVPNPPPGLTRLPLHMNLALSVPAGSSFFVDDSLPASWPTVADLATISGVPLLSIVWQIQIGGQRDELSGTVLSIAPGTPVPLPGTLPLMLGPALYWLRIRRPGIRRIPSERIRRSQSDRSGL